MLIMKRFKYIQTNIHCMVKHIHATLDDKNHAEVERVKDGLNLTWEQFVMEAAEELEDSGND